MSPIASTSALAAESRRHGRGLACGASIQGTLPFADARVSAPFDRVHSRGYCTDPTKERSDAGLSYAEVVTIPNILSASRGISGPILGYMLMQEQYDVVLPCVAIFGFTDWLDGYIAKQTKQETSLGSYLDPLADKVFVMSLVSPRANETRRPKPVRCDGLHLTPTARSSARARSRASCRPR